MKFERVLANYGFVSILKYDLANPVTIDVRAIEALDVLKNVVIFFPIDLGVMTGDCRVIDAQDVIWLAANRHGAEGKGNLVDDSVFKFE